MLDEATHGIFRVGLRAAMSPAGGVGPDAACGDPSGCATPPCKIDPVERPLKQVLGRELKNLPLKGLSGITR